MLPEEDLRDVYGKCKITPCNCLKPKASWLGRYCPNWVPLGPKNQEELAEWHRKNDPREA